MISALGMKNGVSLQPPLILHPRGVLVMPITIRTFRVSGADGPLRSQVTSL